MRLLAATALAMLSIVGLPAVTSAAPATTCTAGLAPGTYGSVVVPPDAVCLSDGPVTIRGGLYVEQGATFGLGSEESSDTGTISGGVHARNAANVQIHFATINGGIDVEGGSGPFYAKSPFCFPDEVTGEISCITWNTIEDSTIHGAVTINGYDGFWMGFIRNHARGSVTLTNNKLVDPDGNEYVTNSIWGSLNCSGNVPPAQVGDSMGEANVVTGAKTGECASL